MYVGFVFFSSYSHSDLLAELRKFIFVDGEPCKTRQKLLRNLEIVGFLMRVLRSFFSNYKGNENTVKKETIHLKLMRKPSSEKDVSIREVIL